MFEDRHFWSHGRQDPVVTVQVLTLAGDEGVPVVTVDLYQLLNGGILDLNLQTAKSYYCSQVLIMNVTSLKISSGPGSADEFPTMVMPKQRARFVMGILVSLLSHTCRDSYVMLRIFRAGTL